MQVVNCLNGKFSELFYPYSLTIYFQSIIINIVVNFGLQAILVFAARRILSAAQRGAASPKFSREIMREHF